MAELMVDLITSLDGYASAEGWPGWWGLEGPEYLGWLEAQPEKDYEVLMGATTYRLMSQMSRPRPPRGRVSTARTRPRASPGSTRCRRSCSRRP